MANVHASKDRTTVILPKPLKAEAQAFSKSIGKPFNEIMRRALVAYLDQSKQKEVTQ